MRCAPLALMLAMLAGCSGIFSEGSPLGVDGNGDGIKTLVPNRTINLSPSARIPVEGVILGAAVLWYVDPLAPTWSVGETRLSADRYRIALRQKPVTNGGDGEANAIFLRRAEQLARDQGKAGYEVLEFNTGIESALPFPYRVASGVVQLR
ncbi:MAG: hypothetical protein ACM3SS_24420 [Rhodospirillaceae bacterium]